MSHTPPAAILAEDAELALPVIDEPALILPDPEPPKKKKRSFFWKAVSIYAVLLLAVGVVALWFFHTYLSTFEAGTTNAALRTYMEWVETENYEAIYEASGFKESGLNTKEQYLAYFKSLFSSAEELTLREKVTVGDNTTKQYSLYSGNKKLTTLTASRSPEGDGSAWYISTAVTYQKPFKVIASDDMRLTVNGQDINLLSLPSKELGSTLFPAKEGATVALPVIREYTLEGLLNPPDIRALTLSGENAAVEIDGQTIRVLATDPDETIEANKTLATEAALTYAEFVSMDASRAQILKYIHKDSAFYETVRTYNNTWFGEHNTHEFRNVVTSDYYSYGSSDFSCTVSFQPFYTRGSRVIEGIPARFHMTFLRTDDGWKLFTLVQGTVEKEESATTTTATTVSANG